VWRVNATVIRELDARFGDPVDAYVNGSQTWLRDDGPGGEAIEWRLHPVPNWLPPADVAIHEVFARVSLAVTETEDDDHANGLASALWDGLEAFPAYGDEMEPAPLAAAVTEALGVPPDGVGLVDHDEIADAWEHSGGSLSITKALLDQIKA